MLYRRARSFKQHLQLLVKLRVKDVYRSYIFLTITISLPVEMSCVFTLFHSIDIAAVQTNEMGGTLVLFMTLSVKDNQ
jgi:hypothetical protein